MSCKWKIKKQKLVKYIFYSNNESAYFDLSLKDTFFTFSHMFSIEKVPWWSKNKLFSSLSKSLFILGTLNSKNWYLLKTFFSRCMYACGQTDTQHTYGQAEVIFCDTTSYKISCRKFSCWQSISSHLNLINHCYA